MKLVKGDLFTFSGEFLLVTTNSYVKKDGSLVMGRGAAYQAAQLWPDLPFVLGETILEHFGNLSDYNVIIPKALPVGAFQVKYHWRDGANPQLIKESCDVLSTIARAMPSCKFALNFPGIGNGRLDRDEVLPIIESLPNNVYVYER